MSGKFVYDLLMSTAKAWQIGNLLSRICDTVNLSWLTY